VMLVKRNVRIRVARPRRPVIVFRFRGRLSSRLRGIARAVPVANAATMFGE